MAEKDQAPQKIEYQQPVDVTKLVNIGHLKENYEDVAVQLRIARESYQQSWAIRNGEGIDPENLFHNQIERDILGGKDINQIVQEKAGQVNQLHEEALERELPYRQAEASLLKDEVGSSVSDLDLISVCESMDRRERVMLDDPAAQEVHRRMQSGETRQQIREKAQVNVNFKERSSKVVQIAEAMKNGSSSASVSDSDIETSIQRRRLNGESLDDIIAKSKANLSVYEEIDRKKIILSQIEARIEEIRKLQELAASYKVRTAQQSDDQQLDYARQQLNYLQGKDKQKVEQAELAAFTSYVYQGGRLIKDGKFSEAIAHFENKGVLSSVGYRLAPPLRRFVSKLPTPDEYGELANFMASRSQVKEDKVVEISNIDYYQMGDDGLPQKQTIPAELQHEVALVHMEEWLHVLQNIRGEPLTKGVQNDEVDVALYMQRTEIPMTHTFLARYGRKRAVEQYIKQQT